MAMSRLHHGGPDALGVAPHDFSTNGNACGPCPEVVDALRRVDAAHYPDPHYTALREQLANFHGVAVSRIVVAASASEFISRITAAVAQSRPGSAVALPMLSYGDYARAARAWNMPVVRGVHIGEAVGLAWHCDPSSPLGQSAADADVIDLGHAFNPSTVQVVDLAYTPLRLDGSSIRGHAWFDSVWQMWTPNKALGLTGVRAAYAIAPVDATGLVARLEALAPSWPIGSHGVTLLECWAGETVQSWLDSTLDVLRQWRDAQRSTCSEMGWPSLPSACNFFVAAPPVESVAALCKALREHGVKLRDTASFGLPSHVRLAVLPPESQAALRSAWESFGRL